MATLIETKKPAPAWALPIAASAGMSPDQALLDVSRQVAGIALAPFIGSVVR